MASPISAILFRLGFKKKSKTWITEWVVPKLLYFIYLQKTLSLLFFVKYFFNQYTTPLFQKTFLRNTTNDENVETTGEENIIKNAFVELNFLYAKTNLYCEIKLQVIVTLYDTLVEQLRNNLLVVKKFVTKLRLMFKSIVKKTKKKRYYLNRKKTLRRKDKRRLPKKQIKLIIKKLIRKLRLQTEFYANEFKVVGKKLSHFKKKYAFWHKKHYIFKRYFRFINRIKRKTNNFYAKTRVKWFINKWFINKNAEKYAKTLSNIYAQI